MFRQYRLLTVIHFLILFSFVSASVSQSLYAQQIEGYVTDRKDRPLQGANVYVNELTRGDATDSKGYFLISDIPAGTYILRFSMIGFKTELDTVSIASDQTVSLQITMEPQSIEGAKLTVTGTPYAITPLATPTDVEILTGKAKLRQQKASLGATLEQKAGISNISTGGQMGKPVIRGLSGQRIVVLQDGIKMEYQQFGVRHGPNVDPFIAEKIEVVRGASSVQYGSDALGGAVNVVSNHIPDARNQKSFVHGRLLTAYATNNNEKVGGIHLDAADGGWGATATLVARAAGNVHVPEVTTFKESRSPEAPKFSGELPYTDYRQINGSIGLGYTYDEGRLTADYIRWSNEQNFLLPSGEGIGQALSNDHLHLSGTFNVQSNIDLETDLSYQRNIRKSNAPGVPRSELPSNGFAYVDLLLEKYAGHLDLVHKNWGPFSGRIGIEMQQQYQQTRGMEPLVPSADIFNMAGFVFERLEYQDWIFNAGMRFDYRSHSVEPNEELNLPNRRAGETEAVLEGQFSEFSGSLGAVYRLTENFSFVANVGRGFRAPSMFELHAEGIHGGVAAYQIGNPSLEPERSLSSDLSVRYRTKRINAKVTVYRNQIENYIMLVNTGEFVGGTPILRYQQANAVMLGGNLSAGFRIADWWSVEGVAEIVRGETREGSLTSVDELPLLPAPNLTFSTNFRRDQIRFMYDPYIKIELSHTFSKEAAGRYEPFWQFGNAPQFSDFGVASTDAYTLVNINAGFDFLIGKQTTSFIMNINNLFNTAYRNFLDTYKGYALSPGRNISFRLVIPFM